MYDSYLNRIGRMAIVLNRVCTPGVGCRTWERSRTIPYDLFTILTRLSPLVECIPRTAVYTRPHMVSHGLVRPLI